MTNPLHTWLAQTLALSGSDLHLSAGLAPMVRVHGALQTLPSPPVCAHQLEALLHAALPDWRVAAHRQDSPAAGASSPNTPRMPSTRLSASVSA